MNQILQFLKLVTDNGFLDKPDQGSGTQGSVENISNKLPPRDSEHCAHVPVFACWLATEQLLSIRDSYAQVKINLRWFRWRIHLVANMSITSVFLQITRIYPVIDAQDNIRQNVYQGYISKCARLFYTKRLWFLSPILGQTFRLAQRRWGIDVSRNVPQRRWAIRNVYFRRLIPGKTDWSYLPPLADRMREVFSRRGASWKWSSVQWLQNNGLLASNKFKADVLSPIFSFFTRKRISLVRVMVKITRTWYVTYSTSVQTQDRWKSPVTRKTIGTGSEFLPQIPYQLKSVSILH